MAWKVNKTAGGTVTEEKGRVTAYSQPYKVRGTSSNKFEAMRALNLPQAYSVGNFGLVVMNRSVTQVSLVTRDDADEYVYEIDVQYGRPDVENNKSGGQNDVKSIFTGGTALEQVTTQVDRLGDDIEVTYNGDTQVGEVSVLAPKSTLTAEIPIETNVPGNVSQAMAGTINDAAWAGGDAETWLCTSATFEAEDLATTPQVWRFTFEFEYNRDGWQPLAYYIDKESGRAPSGLVDGTGKKTVTWYTLQDFTTYLPGTGGS